MMSTKPIELKSHKLMERFSDVVDRRGNIWLRESTADLLSREGIDVRKLVLRDVALFAVVARIVRLAVETTDPIKLRALNYILVTVARLVAPTIPPESWDADAMALPSSPAGEPGNTAGETDQSDQTEASDAGDASDASDAAPLRPSPLDALPVDFALGFLERFSSSHLDALSYLWDRSATFRRLREQHGNLPPHTPRYVDGIISFIVRLNAPNGTEQLVLADLLHSGLVDSDFGTVSIHEIIGRSLLTGLGEAVCGLIFPPRVQEPSFSGPQSPEFMSREEATRRSYPDGPVHTVMQNTTPGLGTRGQ